MARLPVDGEANWGQVLNEYLLVSHKADGAQRSQSASINVKDFGATGDGQTNDAPAIQAAIAALSASGGTVIFPVGIYRTLATIVVDKPHVIFQGEGSHSYSNEALATQIRYEGSAAVAVQIELQSQGFGMEHMGISLPNNASVTALLAKTGYGFLRDVKLFARDLAGNAPRTYGIGLQLGPNAAFWKVYGCKILSLNIGIEAQGDNSNLVISDSNIESNDIGIRLGTSGSVARATITNCSIEYNFTGGIDILRALAVNLDNNYVEVGDVITSPNGQGNVHKPSYYVQVGNNDQGYVPRNITVRNNYITGNDSPDTGGIIRLRLVDKFILDNTYFNSSPGVIINNAPSGTQNIQVSNLTFVHSPGHTLTTSNNGINGTSVVT